MCLIKKKKKKVFKCNDYLEFWELRPAAVGPSARPHMGSGHHVKLCCSLAPELSFTLCLACIFVGFLKEKCVKWFLYLDFDLVFSWSAPGNFPLRNQHSRATQTCGLTISNHMDGNLFFFFLFFCFVSVYRKCWFGAHFSLSSCRTIPK